MLLFFHRLRLTCLLLLIHGFVSGGLASQVQEWNSRTTGVGTEVLQHLVTWDRDSFFIRGERMMLFSGEFHPFRLPVPTLWLDVFQKVKALGFNTVSFYTDWALLEGNRGVINTDGIFGLESFFRAATEAGVYLIARPGPYINAEVAAGGFPGWLLRLNATFRSTDPTYLDATKLYVATIGKIVAAAQITNAGPIILVQPENEYSSWPGTNATTFPNPMNREYIQFVNQQYRAAGIVVPFINNDAGSTGAFAPGTGIGAVDIYGIDAYPMRYDCKFVLNFLKVRNTNVFTGANPSVWPTNRFPTDWHKAHLKQSPKTPFAVPEIQGGSATSWGGVDQSMCNALVNAEAERVLYKQIYSFGVKLMNIYMIFGGTNWGNLGFMGGDSSYDYGAAISEDRRVHREKYSELKLQANFFKISPAYLTTSIGDANDHKYTENDNITITPLTDTQSQTKFYVVRQTDFTSSAFSNYRLNVFSSLGNISVPQLAGQLTLKGRDSKIMTTDYDFAGTTLRYSTAEILTWAKAANGKTVLILYGDVDEWHEFALSKSLGTPQVLEGAGVEFGNIPPVWVCKFQVTTSRRIVYFPDDDLEVHLLSRNDAYTHWSLELPAADLIGNYSSRSKATVVVRGGYLLRAAKIVGTQLHLYGDLNDTTTLEIVHDPFGNLTDLFFNDVSLNATRSNSTNALQASVRYVRPDYRLPDFLDKQWHYIDSLPEIRSGYDDSAWKKCDMTGTFNPTPLRTPVSLYASDYGFHTGSLLYRGHFTATGNEEWFAITTAGGWAFGHSIWINDTFIGSWIGDPNNKTYHQNVTIPPFLQEKQPYVVTVLIDHMGQDEEAPGTNLIKFPLGILDYQLAGREQSEVSWRMTGNLGGEEYYDLARGPRNEGAMYAERQGYHLPNPPSANWTTTRHPLSDGLTSAGVGFFTTSFDLNIPAGYDIPLSFLFSRDTTGEDIRKSGMSYRCQLFINGYQFGRFISHLGPQNEYPVPEGILNYNGTNYLAITLWSLSSKGARIGGLQLWSNGLPLMSGYRKPTLSPQPAWKERVGAY